MITLLKNALPTRLFEMLRDSWYAITELKYYRYYLPGLFFDWFQGDYKTEGMVFHIPKHLTTRIHRARFYYDSHEKEERLLVKKHLPANAIVLELGACLGVVSGLINRTLDDPKAHVAVEANPQLIPVLQENRDLNKCEFAIESGMVSKTSDGSFYITDCIVVSGPVQESERKITVPVFSIEDLVERHNLRFDTLFMDIQGGECALLEEHTEILRQFNLIILELHPHLMGQEATEASRQSMRNAGLSCVDTMGLTEVWKRA